MRRKFSSTPIARYQIFTLADGSYVVQWDDKRVQELLTGNYRDFDSRKDFGHAITEFELKQLKAAGRVEHYNRDYVWLYSLPETARFGIRREMGRGDRIRAYYLSTTLPKSQLENIRALLQKLDIGAEVAARQNTLVLLGSAGVHFRGIDEAEQIQALLEEKASDLFSGLTVAYEEVSTRTATFHHADDDQAGPLSLEELIASQSDTSITQGRQVIMAIKEQEECEAFDDLFSRMKMNVQHASTGIQALELLEDHFADLLLMDLLLPDMHGWQMIRKIKEIETLRDLPVMVITDEPDIVMTVAQVDYLTRPVSIARLRHNVWKILSEHARAPRSSS
jgi:CheY-like chemotaxis protein